MNNTFYERYQYKKIVVVAERILFWLIKVCLFIGGVIAISLTSFFMIAFVVIYIEEQTPLDTIYDFSYILQWYKPKEHIVTGYIPAIVIASASLLLTVITLVQSHYNRIQDRVLDFPRNYLNVVSIGLDFKDNIRVLKKYFNPIVAKTTVEFCFKDSFSSYYEVCPYRFFVCFDKGKHNSKPEWEEIKIKNFQYSKLLDDNPENHEMLIEGSESKLLQEYCAKGNNNNIYRLKIILDVKWANNIMPWWQKKFSGIYIRQTIILGNDKIDTNSNKWLFSENYKALFTQYRPAPVLSIKLFMLSIITKVKRKHEYNKQKKN